MYVKQGNLIFDSSNPLCTMIVNKAQDQVYAFIQCIDQGMDGSLEETRRYWGRYDFSNAEYAVGEILKWGGKWPQLPG